MVVIYTIPSSKYAQGPYQGAPLDEIEITGPPPQQVPQNAQQNASFKLNVKTAQLTKVTASITLTRYQNIPGGAASNLGPAAGSGTIWSYTVSPAAAPYEARWTMPVGTDKLVQNTSQTFTLQFNTGNQPGIYRLTYRVQADELKPTDPVETTFDMVVA